MTQSLHRATATVAADGGAAADASAQATRIATEHQARQELAGFLIGYLSGKENDMSTQALKVRYAVRSDIGLKRAGNEDAAEA